MDIIFKASSLLLLTLVLNVQLYSSAPISAKVVQSSIVAEEPGPEELAPATEDHSHFIKEKESVQAKLIPVAAGKAAASPEKPEQDIPIIVKEPQLVFIGHQVSDDADEDVSKESAPQESLTAAPQESSEEEPTEEIATAVAVENESPQQHYVRDPAPETPIPVIPLEALEDEIPEENAAEEASPKEPLLVVPDDNTEVEEEPFPLTPEEEISVALVPAELETEVAGQGEPAAGESAPEGSVPEEPAVVPMEPAEQELAQEEQEETVPIILSETKEENAAEEHSKEEEAIALVVLEENAEVDLAVNEKSVPSTIEEVEPVTLFPIELEGQVEHAAEETAQEGSVPKEPAVIIPVEPGEQETAEEEQEETVPIILPETKEEEAPEEHAKEEEAVASIVLDENAEVDPATNEEPLPSILEAEESITIFPIELEGQVDPAAEETAPQELAPEDPVVTVPLDPSEKEPELEEQIEEESIPIVSLDQPDDATPEENTEVEAAGVPVPIVPEENAEQDLTINKEPLPSIPEEEESVVYVHAELDTEEKGQKEAAAEETAPEKPAVIVLVEPTSEEPAPEDSVLIISQGGLEKDAPEDNTEEEVVQSDPVTKEAALKEDTAPQENEADDSDAEILVKSVNETENMKTSLDPGEEVPVAVTEVHVATLEPVTAPAITDAEAEIIPAPVEGGNGTSMKTHKDEPLTLLNRGAFLGAAFFTLVLLITIGFVWMTISKKLR